MSSRGFVAWANAHSLEEKHRRAENQRILADHSLRDRDGLRRRLYAMGTDLHEKVSQGELTLEAAEEIQKTRKEPRL